MRDAAWEERERCLYDIALEQREFTEKKIKELFFEKFGSYLVAPGKSVFMRLEELVQQGTLIYKNEHYTACGETRIPA